MVLAWPQSKTPILLLRKWNVSRTFIADYPNGSVPCDLDAEIFVNGSCSFERSRYIGLTK